MSTEQASGQPTGRVNKDGNPCPSWCVTNHDELLIPDKPELGYLSGHSSQKRGYARSLGYGAFARAYCEGDYACVGLADSYGLQNITLNADEARRLARLLAHLVDDDKVTPAQLRKIAAALTDAADLIDPRGGTS